MLEDVISRLPKALEISPIKAHGSNIQARKVQIKEKLAKLEERLEVVLSCKLAYLLLI